jgi:Tfp pilus assembly protein PilO
MRTDRTILVSLAVVGLLAAFYFMILGPKREKASELGDEVTELQASIDQQNQTADFAEQARQQFPEYYGRLVVLGKAVPEQADTSSMLVQLGQISSKTKVDFRGLSLSESSGGAAPAPAAPGATPPAGTSTTPSAGAPAPGGSTTTPEGGSAPPAAGSAPPAGGTTPAPAAGGATATPASSTAAAPAPATEAVAANLPIGATVGPAGLPTLPYDLTFQGSFFDVANFMSGVDSLVQLREGSGQVAANGRLLTVDGFSLSNPTLDPVPELQVSFAVTSYVVPSEQGLTAGATPSGPAPATQPPTTPTSAPVSP